MVLVALLTLGALPLAVTAFQQPAGGQAAAPKVVEVEKLRDNLWMLKGGGGNTAVFAGTNGVVVVDTKNPGWGQPILDQIKGLTSKPITTVINTHTHGDHVSGNVEFPAMIEIIVQENTKKNMETMAPATGIAQQGPPTNIFKVNNGKGLPTKTFKDKMSIGSGNDRIDLYYFGRGHTNGDSFVVFPALRTMHVGDMFAWKALPYVDVSNGGSVVEQPGTLAKVVAGVKDVDTVINGHIPVSSWNDLKDYAAFTKDFVTFAAGAVKAGKTVDQAAAEYRIDPKYKGYAVSVNPLFGSAKANLQIAYDELKKK
jgi:glyoxylase-like metal-dependent hydrolase (beta-lactamase superfamily II)